MIHLAAGLEQRLTTTIDMLPDFIFPALSQLAGPCRVGIVYERINSLSIEVSWRGNQRLDDFQRAVTMHSY